MTGNLDRTPISKPGIAVSRNPRHPAYSVMEKAVYCWDLANPGNTITSGAVETLQNLGTSGGDAPTQGTAGNRPAFIDAGNQSYMEYDSTDDLLSIATRTSANAGIFTNGGTKLTVCRADSIGESAGRVYDGTNGNDGFSFVSHVSGSNFRIWSTYLHATTNLQLSWPTSRIAFSVDRIITERYDKSVGNKTDWKGQIDGTAYTTASNVTVETDLSGAGSEGSGTQHLGNAAAFDRTFDGRMYLNVGWDESLNAQQHAWVLDLCSQRFNIALDAP